MDDWKRSAEYSSGWRHHLAYGARCYEEDWVKFCGYFCNTAQDQVQKSALYTPRAGVRKDFFSQVRLALTVGSSVAICTMGHCPVPSSPLLLPTTDYGAVLLP